MKGCHGCVGLAISDGFLCAGFLMVMDIRGSAMGPDGTSSMDAVQWVSFDCNACELRL